jgi:ribonucleoside-diphosphate reductase alpha chain
LSPLDSCRLLCINLYDCVKNKFSKDSYFDYEELYQNAITAQRLMDDMVDLESEKIDQIIDKINSDPEPDNVKQDELEMWKEIKLNNDEGRRTGVGPTAIGDTIAALNLKYGSEESIQTIEKIYQTLKLGCYRSSVDMAKEIGPFKEWEYNKEKDCEFLLRIKEEDPKLYGDMKKYGRRNVSLTTTAPTGSVSILTQTTSGFEPLYKIDPYIRRRKITDDSTKVDFVDKTGDKWQHYEVLHAKIKEWMEVTGEKNIENSPWYGACANDINWINRVKIQAVAQKHVCHSISSTINLPKNVDIKTIEDIYMTAFDSGCKGITVYRDGCRDGVLVTNENTQITFPEERPRELPCDVHHITSKGQKFFVLVGLYNGRPYEIFAGLNNILNPNIKSGTIVKKKKNFYKAKFDNEDELSPVTSAMTEVQESISRLCSLLLRNEVDIHNIVCQLEKIGEARSDIQCFSSCLSRALKKYIKNGTKEEGVCSECGIEALIRQDGCVLCSACGTSKCN